MVAISPNNSESDLTKKLLRENPPDDRCPHLKVDKISPYCGKDLAAKVPPSEQRRLVCDTASLQLWCLYYGIAPSCIWYNGESFDENIL